MSLYEILCTQIVHKVSEFENFPTISSACAPCSSAPSKILKSQRYANVLTRNSPYKNSQNFFRKFSEKSATPEHPLIQILKSALQYMVHKNKWHKSKKKINLAIYYGANLLTFQMFAIKFSCQLAFVFIKKKNLTHLHTMALTCWHFRMFGIKFSKARCIEGFA